MPKVIVTVNPLYNAIGVRLLLGEIGVNGPLLQDGNKITCMMSEDQISRFQNSRGAAHQVTRVPDPIIVPDPESLSEAEPEPEDPSEIEPQQRSSDGRFQIHKGKSA